MKRLSKSEALTRLKKTKSAYRSEIQTKYEPRAKNCLTCEVQGSCCVDEHFVNVHVTKLEAVAALEFLQNLDERKRERVFEKVKKTIEKYDLKETGDTFLQTFACPLYEKKSGCLIHHVKPVPCIQHACYEKKQDLPPDELQTEVEAKIERLNRQTYGNNFSQLPLPLWINKLKS